MLKIKDNVDLKEILKEIKCYQNEDMCIIMLSQKENKALLNYITNLQKENDRLSNIINELEEWLEDNIFNKAGSSVDIAIENHTYCKVLDKLKELKENKYEITIN